jgi:hypothetical protein
MATVIIKGFIYAVPGHDNEVSFLFESNAGMEDHGWVLVSPHELKAEVPDDFDFLPRHVAELGRRKRKALKELDDVERELSYIADA